MVDGVPGKQETNRTTGENTKVGKDGREREGNKRVLGPEGGVAIIIFLSTGTGDRQDRNERGMDGWDGKKECDQTGMDGWG